MPVGDTHIAPAVGPNDPSGNGTSARWEPSHIARRRSLTRVPLIAYSETQGDAPIAGTTASGRRSSTGQFIGSGRPLGMAGYEQLERIRQASQSTPRAGVFEHPQRGVSSAPSVSVRDRGTSE